MHFVGLTRFSVITEAGLRSWRATRHIDYGQAVRTILSEARLAARFGLFERFALPTIRELMRRNDRYVHLIAVSDRLPRQHAERLHSLVGDLPRVRLLEAGRHDNLRNLFGEAVAEVHNGRTFTFRMDDDDALACDYLDIVDHAVRGAACDVGVSVNAGFVLAPAGSRYRLKRMTRPLTAFGLGLLSSEPRTILDLGNHDGIAARIGVVHVRGRRGWVALAHEHCDNGRRVDWRPSWPDWLVRAWLGPRFAHVRLGPCTR